MTVVPAYMFSLPLQHLRVTIADSAAFRTLTGAANQAEALAKIFPIMKTDPAAADLPYVVVDWAETFRRDTEYGGSRNYFEQSGGAIGALWKIGITETAEADAAFDFLNTLGEIHTEMEALFGLAGYLDARSWQLADGPGRPREDEAKQLGYDFYEGTTTYEWAGI